MEITKQQIQELVERERKINDEWLLPLMYSNVIRRQSTSRLVENDIREISESVEEWCKDVRSILDKNGYSEKG